MRDVVWIQSHPTKEAADRTQGLLRVSGIESIVGEEAQPGYPTVEPATSRIRLGVHADDVRAALEIIWGRTSGKRQ